MMSPDRLVTMANQIGRFFASQPGEDAASRIAEHLRLFWDPRMRAAIITHGEAGGVGLDAVVRQAVALLPKPTTGAAVSPVSRH